MMLESIPEETRGRLTITLSGNISRLGNSPRGLLATVSQIAKVVVSLAGGSLTTPITQTLTGTQLAGGTISATFNDLPVGSTTASVMAYDAAGAVIGSQSKSVAIAQGPPTTVDFAIQLNATIVLVTPTPIPTPTPTPPPTGAFQANVGFTDGPIVHVMTPRFSIIEGLYGSVGVDGAGNLYSNTFGNAIKKISPDGEVSIFGNSEIQGFADGNGTDARFSLPHDLAVDAVGNVYVADRGNGRVRKISPNGRVSTVAGVSNPNGITVDGAGNVYVADSSLHRISKVTPGGTVTVLAGKNYPSSDHNTALALGHADGIGTEATFYCPQGIAVDGAGNVYVAEGEYNCNIRKITPNGMVTTLAGNGHSASVDGLGREASFNCPWDITVDKAGNLYVAQAIDHKIRKITPNGLVTTLAGSGTPGEGALYGGDYIAIDAAGSLYVGGASLHVYKVEL